MAEPSTLAHDRGSLTLQPNTGVVSAIYRRAANIELSSGYYLSIVVRREDMSACAVRVDRLPFTDADIGSPVQLHKDRVALHHKTAPDIDLTRARLWDATYVPQQRVAPRCVAEQVRSALRRHGADGGFLPLAIGGEMNPFAAHAARVLGSGGMTRATPDALAGLEKLVGLGPGLTPSGDDFLSGVFACRALLQQGPAVESEQIWLALPRTTTAGRTLLRMTLSYLFPAYLLSLLRSLESACGQDHLPGDAHHAGEGHSPAEGHSLGEAAEQRVAAVVQESVGHGATSGTDALAGIAWYAALVCG